VLCEHFVQLLHCRQELRLSQRLPLGLQEYAAADFYADVTLLDCSLFAVFLVNCTGTFSVLDCPVPSPTNAPTNNPNPNPGPANENSYQCNPTSAPLLISPVADVITFLRFHSLSLAELTCEQSNQTGGLSQRDCQLQCVETPVTPPNLQDRLYRGTSLPLSRGRLALLMPHRWQVWRSPRATSRASGVRSSLTRQ